MQIDYKVLFPLLLLRNQLKEFCITHLMPLKLDDYDIGELINPGWPDLEVLSLCPSPAFEFVPSKLTISAIIPFIHNCPKLRSLGLWISASSMPSVSFSTSRFKSTFERLDFGFSEIGEFDVTLVSRYLRNSLPVDLGSFLLTSGPSKMDQCRFNVMPASMNDIQRWRRVCDFLPHMTMASSNGMPRADLSDEQQKLQRFIEE
jgi:hypothetical protein